MVCSHRTSHTPTAQLNRYQKARRAVRLQGGQLGRSTTIARARSVSVAAGSKAGGKTRREMSTPLTRNVERCFP
jgi:hypothetical protein